MLSHWTGWRRKCNEVISSPLLYLQVKMVRLLTTTATTTTWPLLVLCSFLSLSVDQSWGTDPLLLEYSDYYYDLYYGDYDDYNFRAGQFNILVHHLDRALWSCNNNNNNDNNNNQRTTTNIDRIARARHRAPFNPGGKTCVIQQRPGWRPEI